jgi:hypothetical protein
MWEVLVLFFYEHFGFIVSQPDCMELHCKTWPFFD